MELFKLFGTILVDNAKANESIHQSEKRAESLSKKLSKGIGTVAKWGTAFIGAGTAIGGAMFGIANSSASAMDEIDKMSAKIGISKQGFQEWRYVLGQNGMSIDKMQVGMKTLVNKMDGVSNGNKTASESFEKLGISVYDSSGKLKDQEIIMKETMFALADMENGTEKAKLATEMFGKAGIEMMPMLNNGSQGMKDLTERAHELGLIVSDESVSAGVKFGDTMDDVKQALGMVGTSIGNGLIPMFQTMADWLLAHMPQIRTAIQMVSNFVGYAVNFVIGILQGLSPVFEAVMSGIKAFWDSYGQVIFNAFIDIVQMLYQQWLNIMPSIQNLFNSVMNILKTTWDSIGKPIFDFIMSIVIEVYDIFMEYFPMISGIVGDVFNMISDYYDNILNPIIKVIGNIITTYLLPVFKNVFNGISGTVRGAFEFISNLWNNTLKPIFNGIITFISGVFSGNWKSAWNGVKSIVSGVWNGIKTAIMTPINGAVTIVKKAIDKIKGFFNFKVEFPKIKLPHFKIKGSANPLKWLDEGVPKLSVEWYKKAMNNPLVMDKPTVFGFNPDTGKAMAGGEAGTEILTGANTMMSMIRNAVNESNGNVQDILQRILMLLSDMLPQMANINLQLDTGAFVGATAPLYDEEFGKMAFRKGR